MKYIYELGMLLSWGREFRYICVIIFHFIKRASALYWQWGQSVQITAGAHSWSRGRKTQTLSQICEELNVYESREWIKKSRMLRWILRATYHQTPLRQQSLGQLKHHTSLWCYFWLIIKTLFQHSKNKNVMSRLCHYIKIKSRWSQ